MTHPNYTAEFLAALDDQHADYHVDGDTVTLAFADYRIVLRLASVPGSLLVDWDEYPYSPGLADTSGTSRLALKADDIFQHTIDTYQNHWHP